MKLKIIHKIEKEKALEQGRRAVNLRQALNNLLTNSLFRRSVYTN